VSSDAILEYNRRLAEEELAWLRGERVPAPPKPCPINEIPSRLASTRIDPGKPACYVELRREQEAQERLERRRVAAVLANVIGGSRHELWHALELASQGRLPEQTDAAALGKFRMEQTFDGPLRRRLDEAEARIAELAGRLGEDLARSIVALELRREAGAA
jgi:hypothetical protein